ncbi:MAG: site-specific integrase [Flaviflexus sp.]|uniref:tyrosine-type recombinase/integrase n=1 Tax=Flaviflexus sp. TaxID=1969482 RepID=UPI00352DB317
MAGMKGDGSIYRRADGKWVAQLELPNDPITGKRRRKRRLAETKTGAQRKLGQLRREKDVTGDLPTGAITVEKYLKTWLERKRLRVKPSTWNGYRSKIEQHVIPVIGKRRLDKLTVSDVELIEDRFVSRGLAMSSAKQTLIILNGAFADAERKGLLNRNPAAIAERPVAVKGRRKAIPVEHLTQFLEANQDDLYLARFILALATSARQGEVLGLELDRLHLDQQWASFTRSLQRVTYVHGCGGVCGRKKAGWCPHRKHVVPAQYDGEQVYGGLWLLTPKSETSKRPLPLGDFATAVMRRYLEEAAPRRFVFEVGGNPIDFTDDGDRWKAMLKRAELPDYEMYRLRHSTATLLKSENVSDSDRQLMMGHSSIDMTEHYTHDDAARLSGAANAMDIAFKKLLSA